MIIEDEWGTVGSESAVNTPGAGGGGGRKKGRGEKGGGSGSWSSCQPLQTLSQEEEERHKF